MGFRFRNSIKIAPGLRLNIGKTAMGLSIGRRGASLSVGTRGVYSNVGIPGTGMSYRTRLDGGRGRAGRPGNHAASRASAGYVSPQVAVQSQCDYIQMLKSFHLVRINAIDWQDLTHDGRFDIDNIGKKEAVAQTMLDALRPSLIHKILPFLYTRKKNLYLKKIEQAAAEDKTDLENYENWKSLRNRILHDDNSAYIEFLVDCWATSVYPENSALSFINKYASDFSFHSNEPYSVKVDFDILLQDIVPESNFSLTATGRLSKRKWNKTEYNDIIQDYVCSFTLFIARMIFEIIPVKHVYINVENKCLDVQTGHDQKSTIVSVHFIKEIMDKINFNLIDPSDSIGNFPHNMDFKKTLGFRPVNPL